MKPQLLKISLEPEHSFSARYDRVPVFYNKWHYHKELELVHIIKGTGSLFVGYDIIPFKSGDLVLLGSQLPHMWGSDKRQNTSKKYCQSHVIHFLPESLGVTFFELPENKLIRTLFIKAQNGLLIRGKVKESIIMLMQQLLQASSTARIISLLQILHHIAGNMDNKVICSESSGGQLRPHDSSRINDIYQFVMANFSKPLKLGSVAKIANLAPNSFCRYFKSRTRKSFSRFLIEVRINHACKLLLETQEPIAEICYESGYNSFSNFNKHFKMLMKRTPLDYRKTYREKE